MLGIAHVCFRTWKSPKGRQGRVRYWRGRLGVKSTVEEVRRTGMGGCRKRKEAKRGDAGG